MEKKHFVSFAALVSFDRVQLVKLYPEQEPAVRFAGVRPGDRILPRDSVSILQPAWAVCGKGSAPFRNRLSERALAANDPSKPLRPAGGLLRMRRLPSGRLFSRRRLLPHTLAGRGGVRDGIL